MLHTCPHCKKTYRIGWTGTVDGCDQCLGIVRDEDGYVFEPGEKFITLEDVDTGVIEVRYRPEGK